MIKTSALLLSSLLLAGCSLFGDRSSYEAPDYQVVSSLTDGVEIRRYDPRLAVEATVNEAEDEDSAFRLLFAYISGANRTQTEIAMTSPVEVTEASQEIAMTVPVETRQDAGDMRMRFFLPRSFTAESAPEPTDPKVQLVTLPSETMAVLRFSGLRGESRVQGKIDDLLADLSGSDWVQAGEPVAYFYDPPWTLPFFRRNEVAIPVVPSGS
ncbi:MAG: heme-binding protein [Pseudomonadota bacterium]